MVLALLVAFQTWDSRPHILGDSIYHPAARDQSKIRSEAFYNAVSFLRHNYRVKHADRKYMWMT